MILWQPVPVLFDMCSSNVNPNSVSMKTLATLQCRYINICAGLSKNNFRQNMLNQISQKSLNRSRLKALWLVVNVIIVLQQVWLSWWLMLQSTRLLDSNAQTMSMISTTLKNSKHKRVVTHVARVLFQWTELIWMNSLDTKWVISIIWENFSLQ